MWVGLVPYGLPGEDEGGDARFGSSAGSVRMLGGWVVAGQRAQPCAASVGRERWGRTAELHPGGGKVAGVFFDDDARTLSS